MNLFKQVTGLLYSYAKAEDTVGVASTVEDLADPTVIHPAIETSVVTTTGAAAATLADGEVDGIKKDIVLAVDGGNLVVTANVIGGNTLTFADAGDSVSLKWSADQDAYIIVSNVGAVAVSTV